MLHIAPLMYECGTSKSYELRDRALSCFVYRPLKKLHSALLKRWRANWPVDRPIAIHRVLPPA